MADELLRGHRRGRAVGMLPPVGNIKKFQKNERFIKKANGFFKNRKKPIMIMSMIMSMSMSMIMIMIMVMIVDMNTNMNISL